MFEALLAAFSLVAISEFGDRSQIAALLLGARYRAHHKAVFSGLVLAFATVFLISVALGNFALSYFPESIIRILSSVAFVVMGVYTLLKKEDEKVIIKNNKEPFISAFSLIALSEIGDKTQIAIIFLAARFQDPVGTFAGALLAEMIMSGAAVFAGKKISERIKMHLITKISGLIFILFGLIALT